ncbi:MAG: hypothetical protein V1801_03005 [Candidatus Falkowbacteria bacterium]
MVKEKRNKPIIRLNDLREMPYLELIACFLNPDEESKLAFIRQLAENFWAGEYHGEELLDAESFLLSFIDKNHPKHHAHILCLLDYKKQRGPEQQKRINDVGIIIFSFLNYSEHTSNCRKLLEDIRQNPPGEHFVADAAEAIKYSKLERPAAATN